MLGVFLNFSPPYIETELLISLIRLLWPRSLFQAPLFLPPVCWITEKTPPLCGCWGIQIQALILSWGMFHPHPPPPHLNNKPRVLS